MDKDWQIEVHSPWNKFKLFLNNSSTLSKLVSFTLFYNFKQIFLSFTLQQVIFTFFPLSHPFHINFPSKKFSHFHFHAIFPFHPDVIKIFPLFFKWKEKIHKLTALIWCRLPFPCWTTAIVWFLSTLKCSKTFPLPCGSKIAGKFGFGIKIFSTIKVPSV